MTTYPTPPARQPRPRLLPLVALATTLAGLAATPSAHAALALIVEDTVRVEVSEAGAALAQILLAKGIPSVIAIPSGGDLGDLSAYSSVWDLRVDTPLQPIDDQRYRDFLATGGGLFLMGEHAVFAPRNNSITALSSVGGGAVIAVNPTSSGNTTARDILEPTNPANPTAGACEAVTEVDYDGVSNGQFTATGNGVWLTGVPTSAGSASWDRGALAVTPAARAVVVLDVNFLGTGTTGTLDFRVLDRTIPTQNRAFVQNLVTFLESQDCCGNALRVRDARAPRAARSAASPCSTASSR